MPGKPPETEVLSEPLRVETSGQTIFILDTKEKVGLMLIPQLKAYLKIDKNSPSRIHGFAGGQFPVKGPLALNDRKPESTGDGKTDGRIVRQLTIKGDLRADLLSDW